MDWPRILGLALALVAPALGAADQPDVGSTNCCQALAKVLPNLVVFSGNAAYQDSLTSYYSQLEQQVTPTCIVQPQSAKDVATAVKSLTGHKNNPTGCKFAIRGGGHMTFAGAANINNGVTIDLSKLNTVSLSSDRNTVSVGSGARWQDVYGFLDPRKLTAAGGRVGEVGVGGLTTGGGISFLAPRIGFACDNVVNFQVVLASGDVVNVNAQQRSDLFLALKGGSNNFGIVTRFDLRTYYQGNMWGGSIFLNYSDADAATKAITNFTSHNTDEYASIIQSYIYAGSLNGFVIVNSLEYTKPVANPPVFEPYYKLEPFESSTLRVTNLSDITGEQSKSSPNGLREMYLTTTFKNDLSFNRDVVKLFEQLSKNIVNVTGVNFIATFEPIPTLITEKSAPRGGNSLGLDPANGPIMLIQPTLQWTRSEDDDLIVKTGYDFINQVDAMAKQRGLTNSWKYINYAAPKQDPIGSYGPQNVARLQAASKKYDPSGVFQKAVPGGFKLPPSVASD